MFVNKKYSSDDIVSFKLVNGDEMVAKMVEETSSHYRVAKPTMLVPSQQGLGLMQAMISGDPNKEYDISKEHVMLVNHTVSQIASHYIETTTGIATVPKGSIIT